MHVHVTRIIALVRTKAWEANTCDAVRLREVAWDSYSRFAVANPTRIDNQGVVGPAPARYRLFLSLGIGFARATARVGPVCFGASIFHVPVSISPEALVREPRLSHCTR